MTQDILSSMDSGLMKVLMVAGASGMIGSIAGFFLAVFGKGNASLRVENTTGIGFLVGASIGTLIGIFSLMLDRI